MMVSFENQADSLSNVDNTQGEEDVRTWFPCPFCYVEIEVQMLCNHLKEEHCFDFKNAVMQTANVNGFLCYIIKKNVCCVKSEMNNIWNILISAVFLEQVCPICAATLGKDPLGHFMVQHAQSVKVSLVH